MLIEPVRFLHAANLRLNHQLHGIGPVPDDLRPILQGATLIAWEQIVQAAIHHEVDFVLVTGALGDDVAPSLAAQVALVRGLEQLADQGVPVFLLTDPATPPRAWESGPEFPENVTCFRRGDHEPVEIERGGKVVATVQLAHSAAITRDAAGRATDEPTPDEATPVSIVDSGPLVVALVQSASERSRTPGSQAAGFTFQPVQGGPSAVHFWALGEESERQTHVFGKSLAHAPGSVQGVSRHEAGPRGCSLVQLDSAGAMAITFLPTAPVRWDELELTVTAATTRDALLEEMQAALRKLQRQACDRLCLVSWSVWGAGPLFDQLQEADLQNELRDELLYSAELAGLVPWTCRWRLHEAQSWTEGSLAANRLEGEYVRQLLQWRERHPDAVEACLSDSGFAGSPWEARLRSLLAELDPAEILLAARRRGGAWFSAQKEVA